MTDKFIELQRTFHELSKQISENDDTDYSQWPPTDKCLNWSDLIKEYRLVILSEAGSGKTTEIRNIACALRNEGKRAFFFVWSIFPRILKMPLKKVLTKPLQHG